MSSIVLPLLISVPLIFAIFSFVFQKYAKLLGIIFASVWLLLSLTLFYYTQNSELIKHNFGGFYPPLGIEFRANGLSALMILLSAFLIFITSIYAKFYLKTKKELLFYPLSAFLSSGMATLFLSTDIFNMYVALELIGLSAVALSTLGGKKDSIKAAIHYLFATLLGSGFYLFAVALLYANYATLHIDELSQIIKNDFSSNIALVFIMIASAIKTALFPFHYWLTPAHSNAPSPVSALLSGIVIKTSFYLLFVIYFNIFKADPLPVSFLSYFGVIAIFYGAILAIFAKDFKVMIAYSTISQVGYLFIVFAQNSSLLHNGAIFALLSHSLAKAGLFLISGLFIMVTGSRNIADLKGVSSVLPFSVFSFGLSSISLIGLPPSLGFVSKWYYLQASYLEANWIFFIAVIFGGALSAVYLFKIIILTLQSPMHKLYLPKTRGVRVLEWCAFTLSLLSVVLGFFASKITSIVGF